MLPEKNDVDVSRLFHWGSKFAIFDSYGKEIENIYIRLVGDAEINRSRVFAIRKSADLRKLLKTEDTDERIAFVSSIYDLDDKSDVINYILLLSTKKFTQDVMRDVDLPMPKEPKSTADLEDFEEYQKAVDNYSERRMQRINDEVLKLIESYRLELLEKPIEQLKKLYERNMIDELCEKEMVTKFRDMCVYFGCYKDDKFKERYFTNFDEFDNLPSEIKEQLINYYGSLEINVEELKKLLEATQ